MIRRAWADAAYNVRFDGGLRQAQDSAERDAPPRRASRAGGYLRAMAWESTARGWARSTFWTSTPSGTASWTEVKFSMP